MEELRRPTADETEEDLLQQQELFLKQKNQLPSKTDKKNEEPKVIAGERNTTSIVTEKNESHLEDKDDIDFQIKEVVFDVKERDMSFAEPFTFKNPSVSAIDMSNFKLKKSNQNQTTIRQNKKQSIFSQLLEKENNLNSSTASNSGPLEKCVLIDGSGLSEDLRDNELKKIHEMNLATLSSMSNEEIQQEQERLKRQLNPDLIKFIQNKGKNKNENPQSSIDTHKPFKPQHGIQFEFKDEEKEGVVLKKEGRGECDALLLEKALESERLCENKPSNRTENAKAGKSTEMPQVAMELLDKSSEGKWRNMSKIEKEKLEWMSDIATIRPKNLETGCTARFDFQGKLLFGDTETPTFEGLHHHGEEPEMAGYSIEELLLLARSTVQSQRILALHTIAHTLDNYWYGTLDGCFDEPLLPMILKAGIVPLYRWALDDTSVTSVAATVTAIHSLLISKSDEICLQRIFCWLHGHITPLIEPHDLIEPDIVLEELTDADLIKLDVVKAFLRMDILPRFMYILYVMQPSPLVCQLIIDICAHFSQHSSDSAKQVVSHAGLLKLVFDKFLPLSWHFVDGSVLSDSVNYCSPMPSAMKLMRIIASSSKELASYLVDKCDLISNITVYLALQPEDGKVPLQDIQSLIVETLKTYHTLLCYGLGFNVFLELFPIFLRQMDFCLSLDINSDKSKQDFDYATHLFKVFEAISVISIKIENQRNSSTAAVTAIFKAALLCLKKWLWQFPQNKTSDSGINLLSSCLNFMSTFCQKSHDGLVCENWKPCSEFKDIFNQYLVPCIKSKLFKALLQNLKSCSAFLSSSKSGNKRDGKTLASLGGVMWEGDIVPPLKEGSPIPLLLAVLKFSILQKQLFNDKNDSALSEFLCDGSVVEYLSEISSEKLSLCGWFSRFESHFLFELLQLSALLTKDNSSFWYKTAVSLLPTLRTPDEYILEELFESIIFNQSFLPSSAQEMGNEITPKLPIIAKDYASCFLPIESISHSKNLLCRSMELTSLSSSSNSHALLSNDFCYAPIYNLYRDPKLKQCDGAMTFEDSSKVISCLQWIYICYELKLPLLKEIPGSVEFSYLSMVFLIDADFFRDVKALLQSCTLALIKTKKVNLSKVKWNDLNGFDNLYLELLNQYDAVSYCDELFGNFVLFPIQQVYPNRWRKLLLTDHSTTLRFLRIPLSKVLVPLQSFLEPCEIDFEIIFQYFKLVEHGAVNPIVCPLIFLMSISHLHNFFYHKNNELQNKQKALLSKVLLSKRKDMKKWILLFSEVNVNSEFGFTMKQELSASDQEHLSTLLGQPVSLLL